MKKLLFARISVFAVLIVVACGLVGGLTFAQEEEDTVPTNIRVQFEIIELIEGFLLVFPAYVYASWLRDDQPPFVVSISGSAAG